MTQQAQQPAHDRNGAPMPVPNDGPSMHDLVCADIAARRAFGYNRYGSLLQANNGRDALRDAYEEALDLVCYLRQMIEERAQAASLPAADVRTWTPDTGGADTAAEVRTYIPPEETEARWAALCRHLITRHGRPSATDSWRQHELAREHINAHRLEETDHPYWPWGEFWNPTQHGR